MTMWAIFLQANNNHTPYWWSSTVYLLWFVFYGIPMYCTYGYIW